MNTTKQDLENAATQLLQSPRGTRAMADLLALLENGALLLDNENRRAFRLLLDGAWGAFATTSRDVMRDSLAAASGKRSLQNAQAMKAADNGSFFSCEVSAADVARFSQSWPGSKLPFAPIRFEFDKHSGDLVDIEPDAAGFDGPELLALSDDAQNYAAQALGLPEACFRRES